MDFMSTSFPSKSQQALYISWHSCDMKSVSTVQFETTAENFKCNWCSVLRTYCCMWLLYIIFRLKINYEGPHKYSITHVTLMCSNSNELPHIRTHAHTNCTNHIFKPLSLPKYLFYCYYPHKHTAEIQHKT